MFALFLLRATDVFRTRILDAEVRKSDIGTLKKASDCAVWFLAHDQHRTAYIVRWWLFGPLTAGAAMRDAQ